MLKLICICCWNFVLKGLMVSLIGVFVNVGIVIGIVEIVVNVFVIIVDFIII